MLVPLFVVQLFSQTTAPYTPKKNPFPPSIMNPDGSVPVDKYPDLPPNFFCEYDRFPKSPDSWESLKCEPIDCTAGGAMDVPEHNRCTKVI